MTLDDILLDRALSMARRILRMEPRRLRNLSLDEVQAECLIHLVKALEHPSHQKPGIRRADRHSPPHSRYESFAFIPPRLTLDHDTFRKIYRHVQLNVRHALMLQEGYRQRRRADASGSMRRQPFEKVVTQRIPEHLL